MYHLNYQYLKNVIVMPISQMKKLRFRNLSKLLNLFLNRKRQKIDFSSSTLNTLI